MIRLFIYNKIKKFGTNFYQGIHNVSLQNGSLFIRNINQLIDLEIGQFLEIVGITQAFEITNFRYDQVNRNYTIEVTGPQSVLNNETRQIKFYTVDESLSESAELDIQSFDLEMDSSIETLQNPDEQKMEISKDLNLEGTERNNNAFGNLFNVNKYIDISGTQRMFANYNPLRTVEAKIFDNGIQLFSGELRCFQIIKQKGKNQVYQCKLIGKLYNIKSLLGESLLTDLDFSDMKHIYSLSNIKNSWGGFISGGNPNSVGSSNQVAVWNKAQNWVTYQPFEYGKNYVYPFIDYGNFFDREFENSNEYKEQLDFNYDQHKLQNFKPAVYLKEYLSRIFGSRRLRYQITSSVYPNLVNEINRLIIPYDEKGLTSISDNNRYIGRYSIPVVQPLIYLNSTPGFNINSSPRNYFGGAGHNYLPIRFNNTVDAQHTRIDGLYGQSSYSASNKTRNTIQFTRTVKTDGYAEITFLFNDSFPDSLNQIPIAQVNSLSVELAKRTRFQANKGKSTTQNYGNTATAIANEDFDNWEVIASKSIDLNRTRNVPIYNRSISAQLEFQEMEFQEGEEIQLRIKLNWSHSVPGQFDDFILPPQIRVQAGLISLPRNAKRYEYGTKLGDYVTPRAPKEITQIDFLKAFMTIYNMFLIWNEDDQIWEFMTYDDYYLKFSAFQLKQTAIDFTTKVDWNEEFKISSNLDLAKEYEFKFSDADDYFSKTAKEKDGRVYGSFIFTDALGIEDKKTIESIFQPSPMLSIGGTFRWYSQYSTEPSLLEKKEMDNIGLRILFYNGVRACTPYRISDYYQFYLPGGNWFYTVQLPAPIVDPMTNESFISWYPQASNYLMSDSGMNRNTPFVNNEPAILTPITDIHFFRPATYFFEMRTQLYLNLEGSYKYWRNAISQDVNPMMKVIECTVRLTKAELKELDHDVPAFLDSKDYGSGYFKILKYVWGGDTDKVKMTLQQIIL